MVVAWSVSTAHIVAVWDSIVVMKTTKVGVIRAMVPKMPFAYHAGDVASLLQHLGQGGLVERKASHRGDGKVVRDSIAKA